MEFANEIKQHIFSYLPRPYKTPTHVNAINKTPIFADMSIDRLLFESEEEIDGKVEYLWMNSYIEYKKWRYLNISY